MGRPKNPENVTFFRKFRIFVGFGQNFSPKNPEKLDFFVIFQEITLIPPENLRWAGLKTRKMSLFVKKSGFLSVLGPPKNPEKSKKIDFFELFPEISPHSFKENLFWLG